jgi:NAD(P)-dependent dehydrogenase (short-subunit alcohol dehydrogenase family)
MNVAKTLLVTGTSSGLGLAVAVAAARGGWHTVATMRDPTRDGALREAAETAGVQDRIQVERLDVTDSGSVDACMARVVAARGRLDAVVNNAGAGHVGTIEQETLEDVYAVMEVNFFGVVRVTRAALPHLRAAAGRLVTVSSVGGVVGQPFNEAYCAAKFAVEGFMEALAPVAATTGVSVTVVEPGAVLSEFVANVGESLTSAQGNAGPYARPLAAYLDRTRAAFSTNAAQTPDEAAATIIEALTVDSPPLRIQTSAAARDFVGTKLVDLDGSAVVGLTRQWLA